MKLTIESTDQLVELDNGIVARMWTGKHEDGTECLLFVVSIATLGGQTADTFERELIEIGSTCVQVKT